MSAKILELNPANRRHPMSDDALRLLATLRYGPALASVMATDMAKVPAHHMEREHRNQRALLQGGNLPASLEMVKRLPPFALVSDVEIQDALQALCDADLLEFDRGYFVSRVFMAGIEKAAEQFDTLAEEARDPS